MIVHSSISFDTGFPHFSGQPSSHLGVHQLNNAGATEEETAINVIKSCIFVDL